MIDIRFVLAHGAWILGAAIVLAAFSYYDWRAREQGRPRRDVLREKPVWKLSKASGLLLIASGFLLMTDTRWWEYALWLVIWGGTAHEIWKLWRMPGGS
jgi:hypothetical protein